MAAYASLLSLEHILEQILQHPLHQMDVLDIAQIDYLLQNITFLKDFLEDFSLIRGDEIQGLEEKIARSAYAAEDVIEMHVVDQILEDFEAGNESSSTLSCQDLRKVIEEFDSMKKDVLKFKETEGIKIIEQPRKAVTDGSFIRGSYNSKNTMVGFREDLIQIMERLTGDESNLQIHSIVGMGGIGKTTLAKNVFDNQLIVHHFDLRSWVTISQQYSVNKILSDLLKDIGVLTSESEGITQKNDEELGLCLHKSLFDRRYFIVMDDLWSIEIWDDIKRFFPDNDNSSRVMVTTRLSNVADNFHSCTPHQLHFLDKDQSWALFCDKVFGKESCPPEFKKVGKTIVRNCGGLPLVIVAISGLLAKSNRTFEYWDYVANDTFVALNMGGDELCLEILSLSYKHLPVHLKPCFLYMATFPEDHEIRISRLVKLWIAEGILKPIRSRSLEEIAEDYLKDLIDRNLILIHKYGSRNKIKSCTIHDLLRDLCHREAQKEKFLCVTKMHNLNNRSKIIDAMCPFIGQRSFEEEECKYQVFDTRILACGELKSTSAKLHRLQKVLNMDVICSYEEIVRVLNSRYIDLDTANFSNLLNTLEPLSVLCNMQTITISSHSLNEMPLDLPAEIWEMPQFRHLKRGYGDFYLPDPPSTKNKNGRRDVLVLKNMQTLHKIRNFRFTDEVVCRIPNLKKLGIIYGKFPRGFGWDYFGDYCHLRNLKSLLIESEVNVPGDFRWDYYEIHNLVHLCHLESLVFESDVNVPPSNLCFPRSLKKLTLRNCGVCWEDLTVVGILPHLEVLNLMDHAVKGSEWNPVEGQFLELKALRIEFTDLVDWIADSSHFPSLEKLKLRFLRRLKEIPSGIGEIQTLGSISLIFCSGSAISSAKKIEEEQQNLGNSDFELRVK